MQDQNNDDQQQSPVTNGVSGLHKEQEVPRLNEEPTIEAVKEFEVSPEVARHVTVQRDTVEIPPDLRQLGVQHAPQDQTAAATVLPNLTLPLTDDQIGEGLQAGIRTSFRWLAAWCVKQLEKLHVHLKKIHGHFIRVMEGESTEK
ncbi:MAG TPA: hypothetical protein VJL83_01980 [Patescibacteria group bacterium]|nr:hypothetical protein [Patescibacteria group bacterium]